MRYRERDISKLLQLLVILALVLSGKEESRVNRVKRLATPNFDRKVYQSMAKYVVSIRSRSPKSYFGDNHFCGGSIISPRFVISAAVCVMDDHKILFRSRMLMVVAGAPNRLKIVTGDTQNVPVSDIYVPTNYTVYNTNNIAIMKLAYDLPSASKHIGIINLPTQPPATDLIYRVLGWGRVYKGGPLASRLLFIDVTLQKRNVCESMIENFKPEMLCAGNMNAKYDENPCLGDSGDPLLLNLTIYGIASYGLGCGYGSMPSVYTDVWYHMDWIHSVMNRNASHKYQLQPHYMLLLLSILIFVC